MVSEGCISFLFHHLLFWVLISVLLDVFLQPEMEMVARSLEKHLKVEQRQDLMNMLVGVCGEESRRTVAEALGLVSLGMPDLVISA